MPWFNVDDGFAFHRKVVAAGNAAIGLWARAGAWSAGELTEGFIPDHMVSTMGTLAQARKLVTVGLWTTVEGGYQFHEWSDDGRNPTPKICCTIAAASNTVSNEADKVARAGGSGSSLSVISVTIPSIPSDPTKRPIKSNPVLFL